MKLIGSNTGEPEDDGTPASNVAIRVTVPEEFAGTAIGQVNVHQGSITDIKHEAETLVIYASIPARLFQSLVEFVTDGTQGKAVVQLQDS